MIQYKLISERVNILDIAATYGIEVNGRNKALCPFHSEKTPSLSFYKNRFNCFGCGESGDAIDFTAKLLNLPLPQAAAKINSDFGLGFDLAKGDTPATVSAYVLKRRRLAAFRKYEQQLFIDLCDEMHRMEDIMRSQKQHDEPSAEFLNALNRVSLTEHFIDKLTYATEEEKIEWLSQNRREVETYAGRIPRRNQQGVGN